MSRARSLSLAITALGLFLCLFTLAEVNWPRLATQSELALFSLAALLLCFLTIPAHPRLAGNKLARGADLLLAAATVLCWLYVVVQTEPFFRRLWSGGQGLGNRAGNETSLDILVGIAGLLLVLEATRRAIGLALPLLAIAFLTYAFLGPHLPAWLLPHRGYSIERVVSQTFLHSQGVFGVALGVMFTYVFLFVLMGAFLQKSGATAFIIDLARRLFHGQPGAPAKIAVISSGLMGSLSGSAVANTATTGTFTIPMMRSAGFSRSVAAGIEAAASSGGALMPPVMGAGAYMMLEIVEPPVTYLQVIRAALLPAILYYLSLFLLVHFMARKTSAAAAGGGGHDAVPVSSSRVPPAGLVFVLTFASLLGFLFMGYTAFRAVSLALLVGVVVSALFRETRQGWHGLLQICVKAARDMVPLAAAASCVGIVLGVVTLTGAGTRLPALLLPLAQESLLLALIALMISSLVLGMGLPSVVCYLLMATLVGPVLGRLGVVPLAAHLFIFYFGMMSMVTPPVALAAYTAASIAGASILGASMAAFRFALVGFTLPFMFVFRPQLLMLDADGGTASVAAVVLAVVIAVLGIIPFAAGVAGSLYTSLTRTERALLLVAAAFLLVPGPTFLLLGRHIPWLGPAGVILLVWIGLGNRRQSRRLAPGPATGQDA